MTDAQVTARRLTVWPRAESRSAFVALLRRHKALVALLAVGLVLRIVALVAIYPGIWFSDTNDYLHAAATGTLGWYRVDGYALPVAFFRWLGSAGALVITQHVIALGLVVLVYALLLRRGVPKLLATLAVVPLALDAYLIDVEHAIMSETFFHLSLLGGIALLLWRERLGLVPALAAGLLLGYGGVVRSVGVPIIAIFVAYLLVRRVGWKPLLAFCVGWVVMLGGYMTIYHAQHGVFAFNQTGGRFLYAKVAPFANCSRLHGLPADERAYCPNPRHRLTPNAYLWGPTSPIHKAPLSADPRIRDFAKRVIRNQPGKYARLVLGNFFHYFEPGHRLGPGDYSDLPWHFPRDPSKPEPYPGYRGPIRPGHRVRPVSTYPGPYVNAMVGRPHTNARASRFLHVYQRFFFTSGELLAMMLIVVLVALVLRRGAWRLRLDAAALALSAVVALLMSSVLSVFSYRYGLTAVVLLPPAAALAGAALLGPRPTRVRTPRRRVRQRSNRRSTTRAAALPSSSAQNSEANAL